MPNNVIISNKKIGRDYKPFIIAELSGNHNHSLERALKLVDAAAEAGADAIKVQTYTADTMTLNISKGEFIINNPESLWNGKTLYELYEEAHLPWEWHEAIFERAREKGLVAFSTPFDATAVEFLNMLNVPCFKIASFELTDLELIKRVAETGKPLIMSLGMANLAEIAEAVQTAEKAGAKDIILLKCTSSYPAKPEQANLITIPALQAIYDMPIGLSDHTMGIGVAIAAVALGATVIEKHFTLDRSDGGVDSAFSLEPQELSNLVKESTCAWKALGHVNFGCSGSQEKSERLNRRSLYIIKNKHAGEKLLKSDIAALRPGSGMEIKYLDMIIGRELAQDVGVGTPVSLEIFSS